MKTLLKTVIAIGLLSPIAVFTAEYFPSETLDDQHVAVHIRSLAASCAACHGTNGNAVNAKGAATLAGMNKNQLSSQLMAFKAGKATATVMHRHAKGLTDGEIKALAAYFSIQPVAAPYVLNPEKFQVEHAH